MSPPRVNKPVGLKNLGPKTQHALALIGIATQADLQAQDPFKVYARLKAQAPVTSLNALYALIGAVEDKHWLDIQRERRTEILMRLDDMGLAP